MKQNNNLNTNKWKNIQCPKCGKTNIGWQDQCLFCGANLLSTDIPKEATYKCPSCGARVKKGQKFCTNCGHKLPENLEPVIKNVSEVKRCPNCGAVLKPGAKFCTECGTKV